MDAFSDLFLDAEQCESTACVELELDSSDVRVFYEYSFPFSS